LIQPSSRRRLRSERAAMLMAATRACMQQRPMGAARRVPARSSLHPRGSESAPQPHTPQRQHQQKRRVECRQRQASVPRCRCSVRGAGLAWRCCEARTPSLQRCVSCAPPPRPPR
jgi:hypothetical protein